MRGPTFGPPVGFFAPKMACEFSLGKLHIYPQKGGCKQKNMVHLKINQKLQRKEMNRTWGSSIIWTDSGEYFKFRYSFSGSPGHAGFLMWYCWWCWEILWKPTGITMKPLPNLPKKRNTMSISTWLAGCLSSTVRLTYRWNMLEFQSKSTLGFHHHQTNGWPNFDDSGVIAFALTASNDERCVVCSRFKHQHSQLSLKFAQNFLRFVSYYGNVPYGHAVLCFAGCLCSEACQMACEALQPRGASHRP